MTTLATRSDRRPRSGARGRPNLAGETAVVLGLVVLLIGAVLASSGFTVVTQLAVVGATLVVALTIPAVFQARRGADLTPFLLAPIVLSAFQNVYLLPVVPDMDPAAFPVIIIINFVDAVLLLGVLAVTRSRTGTHPLVRVTAVCLGITTAWGWASALVFGAEMVAALSAFRNIVTPLVFLLLGLLAARSTRPTVFAAGVVAVATVTIAFGFWELNATSFWQDAGIRPLWNAKSLGIRDSTGLPGNFFSSELFDGRPARRMVSSFADPVHFGTFLFVAFAAAVWLRRWIIAGFCVAAASYAVSKGFLLSSLVFVAVWARTYANPVVQALAVLAALGTAVWFYTFAGDSSTGSTDVHIDGFLAAFTELPGNPIGRGLGNSGVRRAATDEYADRSDVSESGIGVIISQLGVIGLVVFGVFFVALVRAASRVAERNTRLVAVGLSLAFLLNATFNEVALSPNSAAAYFILIGLVIGSDHLRRQSDPIEQGTPWK